MFSKYINKKEKVKKAGVFQEYQNVFNILKNISRGVEQELYLILFSKQKYFPFYKKIQMSSKYILI